MLAPPAPTFLDELDASTSSDLLSIGQIRRFKRTERFALEGDPASRLGLVLDGFLKSTRSSTTGRTTLFGVHGQGDLVGIVCTLDGGRRLGTISAVTNVRMLVIDSDSFDRFVRTERSAAYALMGALCRELRNQVYLRCDASAESMPVRVARGLSLLADAIGRPTQADGGQLCVPLTQEEIAEWIGTSRESVARALHCLRNDGVVNTTRRELIVLAPEQLRAIGDGWTERQIPNHVIDRRGLGLRQPILLS